MKLWVITHLNKIRVSKTRITIILEGQSANAFKIIRQKTLLKKGNIENCRIIAVAHIFATH